MKTTYYFIRDGWARGSVECTSRSEARVKFETYRYLALIDPDDEIISRRELIERGTEVKAGRIYVNPRTEADEREKAEAIKILAEGGVANLGKTECLNRLLKARLGMVRAGTKKSV